MIKKKKNTLNKVEKWGCNLQKLKKNRLDVVFLTRFH